MTDGSLQGGRFTRRGFLKAGGAALLLSSVSGGAVPGATRSADGAPAFAESTVWAEGEDGYPSHFVYGLAITNNGTALTFTEARIELCDECPSHLVLKRSTDGGASWGNDIYVETSAAGQSWSNPAALVDPSTGKAFVFYVLNEANNSTRVFYKTSTDDGLTWSVRRELTGLFQDNPYGWTFHMPGPGHGIRLRGGRLLMQMWHRRSVEYPLGERRYGNSIVYSDDGGGTWRWGGKVQSDAHLSNESRLYEREDGSVVLNARSQGSTANSRVRSVSTDGGLSWAAPVFETSIPPAFGTDASIARLTRGSNSSASRIVYSHPTDRGTRKNMFVQVSYDDGFSWSYGKTVYAGGAKYSDLAVLPDGTVLLLYGKDDNQGSPTIQPKSVAVARFNVEWLTDGQDILSGGPSAGLLRTYQTEGLRVPASSGDRRFMFVDSNASGGGGLGYESDALGDYVEHAVRVTEGKTYGISVRARRAQNRARVQLKIDGENQGEPFDPYVASGVGYAEYSLGTKSLGVGEHRFRFEAVGKNSGSTGYAILVDSVRLSTP